MKDSGRHDATSSENSETKSLSVRKSLFKSPLPHKSGFVIEGNSTDYILTGWIQKQIIYIKALEKEVAFYRVCCHVHFLILGHRIIVFFLKINTETGTRNNK